MTVRRRLAGVGVAASALAALLHLAGRGSLSAPSVGSWADLDAWYELRGAGVAVVAMVRLAALAASSWLALAAGLQIVATSTRTRPVAALADHVSPRFLRTIARGAASLSISAGLTLPAAMTGPVAGPPGTVVMVPLDAEPTTTTSSPPPPITPPAEPPPTTPAPVQPVPARGPSEVVVAPGQSFWSIAAEHAAESDPVDYWLSLIEENRPRLVDPTNPDLLYPGQILHLPAAALAS